MIRMVRKYHPFLNLYKWCVIIMKKEKEVRKSSRLLMIFELLCVLIFIYAILQMISIYQDYHIASKEYEALSEHVTIVEKSESNKIENGEESETDDEINIPDYYVDLEAVKLQNEDTIGWIILPDSKINYPILKSKDNAEYMNTTFEGQRSSSGAIFMDMLCESDFSDENTIIYGHNMKNGSMFRALNNLTDKEYFFKHRIFCIDMGNGFENYEIISCYETVETNFSSWQISFDSKEAYGKWLENIAKRCTYDCMDYDVDKNTITLSTCRGKAGGPGRFVVHLQKKDKGGN